MQKYIIKKLRYVNEVLIFTLNKTTGLYESNQDSSKVRGLMDFIGISGYSIYSIIRNSDKKEITVGDILPNGAYITKLVIDKNKMFYQTIESNDNLPIEDLILTKPKAIVPKKQHVFSELEAKIESSFVGMEIKLHSSFINSNKTIEEFVVNFFKEYNSKYTTTYTKNVAEQCTTGRRRSLGDVYMITKFYFPECTLLDIIELMYGKLWGVNKSQFCSAVKKRVFRRDTSQFYSLDTKDEYGNLPSYYQELIKYKPIKHPKFVKCTVPSGNFYKDIIYKVDDNGLVVFSSNSISRSMWNNEESTNNVRFTKSTKEDYDLQEWMIATKAKNLSLEEIKAYINNANNTSINIFNRLLGVTVNEKADYLYNLWNPKQEPKTLLEQAKDKFPKGTKYKSVITNKLFEVDTNRFEEVNKYIFTVSVGGSARAVYSREKNIWAEIIK